MTITVDEMVDREVIYCVSTLVGDLMKILPDVPYQVRKDTCLDYDELLDLCGSNDWEEPARWHVQHDMSREDLIDALILADIEPPEDDEFDQSWLNQDDKALQRALRAHLEEDDLWQTFCEERNIEPYFRETYEFWIVSRWLGAQLKEKGELVDEVSGLLIWGRGGTGQSISMDGVIKRIHAEMIAPYA